MPVFPPTAASTIPATVVGIATQSIPRSQEAAAKPERSVIAPPPTPTIKSERVNPAAPNQSQSCIRVLALLATSESGTAK